LKHQRAGRRSFIELIDNVIRNPGADSGRMGDGHC
jgi:hypothetical protein